MEWAQYKSASKALDNTTETEQVEELAAHHSQQLVDLYKLCLSYLREGVLTKDYVLDNVNALINTVREANVTIRWLMMQRTTCNAKLSPIVKEIVTEDNILQLLLVVSQFESNLTVAVEQLLKEKPVRWNNLK